MLKDHLGSASVITDSAGAIVAGAQERYYRFGEKRLNGTMQTDKLFTGQREMAGLGIYQFGARFYSPKLGRFIQPDTIVPDPSNPQDLNRFSYVRNNPLKFIDPPGHGVDCGIGMGCVTPYRPPSGGTTTISGSRGFGGVTTAVKPKPGGIDTGEDTLTPTVGATPILIITPTATPTVTPPCRNASNLCATIVAEQATSVAFQTPTATPTPTPFGTVTPFAYNAVQTLVGGPINHCFGRPNLSNAPTCGEMVDLGLQLLGQYAGIPVQEIPQPGKALEVSNSGAYVLGDMIEATKNEPSMTQQQAQTGLGYTIVAFVTTILPWVLAL